MKFGEPDRKLYVQLGGQIAADSTNEYSQETPTTIRSWKSTKMTNVMTLHVNKLEFEENKN